MKKHSLFRLSAIILFASLACNLATRQIPTSVPLATRTNTPQVGPTFTIKPTSPPPTDISTPQPTHTPTEVGPETVPMLPTGFVTTPRQGSHDLGFYDGQGKKLGTVNVPGFPWGSGTVGYLHLAGRFSSTVQEMPVVYFTFDEGGLLRISRAGEVETLVETPSFVSMLGLPGEPKLAYVVSDYLRDGSLKNKIFFGELAQLSISKPLLESTDPESWSLAILGMKMKGGELAGLWLAERAYGIGGDIVFEPRRRLVYFNAASGDQIELLARTANPWSLSQDQAWVAYSEGESEDAFQGAPLSIQNLATGEKHTFPLLITSDRGAGDAVFSPDSRYVAWVEGSGSFFKERPNFFSILRIASTRGEITSEVRDVSLAGIARLEKYTFTRPIGWLDSKTVVVQVSTDETPEAVLVTLKFDGSSQAFLAPGAFAGFLYP